MPYHRENDTQPDSNTPNRKHRSYVPAVWAAPGGGTGHPKLSGGYEVDKHGTPIATRGLNRPDQRYTQPSSTASANRQARAIAESPGTLCLLGADNNIEVRGASGNNYDCQLSPYGCDCPDFRKLSQSYSPSLILCKHLRIVVIQTNAVFPNTLDWSCWHFAQLAGIDVRTVEGLCQRGEITASKSHDCWVIPASSGPADVAAYVARLIIF